MLILFCLSSDPPIIELTKTEFEVNVSESVTFTCDTKPYPRVINLVWEKEIDGVTTYINTGHMSNSLTLTNVDLEDSGIYRCIANNSAGSTNMSFTLLVTTGNILLYICGYDVVIMDTKNTKFMESKGTNLDDQNRSAVDHHMLCKSWNRQTQHYINTHTRTVSTNWLIQTIIGQCDHRKIITLAMKTITSVLKVSTYITSSITDRPSDWLWY